MEVSRKFSDAFYFSDAPHICFFPFLRFLFRASLYRSTRTHTQNTYYTHIYTAATKLAVNMAAAPLSRKRSATATSTSTSTSTKQESDAVKKSKIEDESKTTDTSAASIIVTNGTEQEQKEQTPDKFRYFAGAEYIAELSVEALKQRAEIVRFCDFLRIRSISHEGPSGSYWECVHFLEKVLKPHLQLRTFELVKGKPVLIATYPGTDPNAKSIFCNGHYDVVPVVDGMWKTDPFAANITDNGDIVARGAQDMKSVVMQYVEALLSFAKQGKKFRRTIHLSFVPDEEIGGADGLGVFSQTDDFKKLNIGCGLDEGHATLAENHYTVFNGERAVWWLEIRATGPTGHASKFIKDTAMSKLIGVINNLLEMRSQEESKLHAGCAHAMAKKLNLGDVVCCIVFVFDSLTDWLYSIDPSSVC
jgi:Peptidase family M20/M25/M40